MHTAQLKNKATTLEVILQGNILVFRILALVFEPIHIQAAILFHTEIPKSDRAVQLVVGDHWMVWIESRGVSHKELCIIDKVGTDLGLAVYWCHGSRVT